MTTRTMVDRITETRAVITRIMVDRITQTRTAIIRITARMAEHVSDNTDTGVKTGDSFAMWFYVILMAAAAGFAGCLVMKKKKLEK